MTTRHHWLLFVFLVSWTACCRCDADIVLDLTYIGNPGNPADSTGLGSVGYGYCIGTYEITVAQYTEFLNAAAQSDPYGLYSSGMANDPLGGPFIIQNGTSGSYTYSAVAGTENQPVRWVSGFDAMRFANWMANGQGSGSTEDGVYDMSLGDQAVRTNSSSYAIPTLDEWYKAAYYSDGMWLPIQWERRVPCERHDAHQPFGCLLVRHTVYTSTGETTDVSIRLYDQEKRAGVDRSVLETKPYRTRRDSIRSCLRSEREYLRRRPPGEDDGGSGFRLVYLISSRRHHCRWHCVPLLVLFRRFTA